ncbi:MarR family winged helix-turn-helix transcriptional regulator [Hymenobacter sp. HDW8]|uniref:MarR family winged helix-turn-helix transcriptional regulator n=1 Tax=Hymenobacter sp. HDW8 TaxID=2714932 RepID=UPI00140BB1FD|nr:MarR family winged helix-turn-helix transcriptional regulator [Hymenobacter sp. HDW8]QIL77077.1 winged helix-turn-helix transcriptional regulator [Hymenobacter sp. HDW8]
MLNEILFYSLDRAIRQYRKFAQANIDRAGIDITVDQWLVLRVIDEHDDLTQADIADRVFKDQASVARIIALLLKRGLIGAEPLPNDGRRTQLRVTAAGHDTLVAVQPVVLSNRATALDGLSEATLDQVRRSLERIYTNCLPSPVTPTETPITDAATQNPVPVAKGS